MNGTPFTLELLASVLGWAVVVNFALLAFSAVFVKAAPGLLHSSQRMWFPDLTDGDIDRVVYGYMALLKVLTIVFLLAPWIGLRIVLG